MKADNNQVLRALRQLIGNKVYMRDIESILDKLELSPQEKQALAYLSRDLEQVSLDLNQAQRKARF